MRLDGRTYAQIAAALGRSARSIQGAVKRMGAGEHPKVSSRLALWLDVCSKPHTVADACRILGCTRLSFFAYKYRLIRQGKGDEFVKVTDARKRS